MMVTAKKDAFSLTEVLMAVGILAIGLTLVAMTFPAGIGLTTVAAERTVAAIVADEAFAKIQLYGIDLSSPLLLTQEFADYNDLSTIDASEYAYPSVNTDSEASYYWSALCRKINDSGRVQVTVFICRKTGLHTRYPLSDPAVGVYDWPRPVPVREPARGAFRVWNRDDQIRLAPILEIRKFFFVSGSSIITEPKGGIYRVLDRQISTDIILELDRDLQERDMIDVSRETTNAWVVPPAVGGGRNPTIGVYQRVMQF